jgi:hypothetical protein
MAFILHLLVGESELLEPINVLASDSRQAMTHGFEASKLNGCVREQHASATTSFSKFRTIRRSS